MIIQDKFGHPQYLDENKVDHAWVDFEEDESSKEKTWFVDFVIQGHKGTYHIDAFDETNASAIVRSISEAIAVNGTRR